MVYFRKYCPSLVRYARRRSVPVRVGNVAIGGGNPIRIQSMTTTDTCDVEASVAQVGRIAAAGADIVRLTAQGRSQAGALGMIRERLRAGGITAPLVADIHFNPEAAMAAAENVEKVRINPGNFVDKRADFSLIEYTDEQYGEELRRLEDKFTALLDVCVANNTALRIGVNHGSLSDRIMSRYGDTPAGMVASAMEFLRVCRRRAFDNVVVSMKSSNTRVMVQAYRLLAAVMDEEEMAFPLHLGVTEAGEGEDGRIKSAVGIGALLADGLGDTIRVSLTEEPECEIPVARKLAVYFEGREDHEPIGEVDESLYSPYEYVRRISAVSGVIGGDNLPVVVMDVMPAGLADDEPAPDFVGDLGWVFLSLPELTDAVLHELKQSPESVVVLVTYNVNGVAEQRAFFLRLMAAGVMNPVIIRRDYAEDDVETLQLKAASDLGPLLVDGFGDGIWISNRGAVSDKDINSLAFGILQAARVRVSRVEYIACPGCGRTLFDLREVLSEVKKHTSHLKGLKIGVMGCIVNGPGEMADADYGYVGAGPGRVTLYKGKEVVRKNIPQDEAIAELLRVIGE